MKPRKFKESESGANLFFQSFDEQLNHNHPLFILANKVNWTRFDNKFGALYSSNGRPGIPTRIMVALSYLKYTYGLSDDEVVGQFCENVYFQYFCGFNFIQHKSPCDSTSLVKWRNRVRDNGLEELLSETLAVALDMDILKIKDLNDVNLDTTVQPKNIGHPTDASLLHKAREHLVKQCEKEHIPLKRNFKRVGKFFLIRTKRYIHAKQFKRANKTQKKLKLFLKKVINEARSSSHLKSEKLNDLIKKSEKVLNQNKKDKNKIYSIHEPNVECIAKGKSHKPYEFGCKTSILTTNRSSWVLGVQALHGLPYDGHTVNDALEQMKRICGKYPNNVYADKGYRGAQINCPEVKIHISGTKRGKSDSILKKLKRRSAVEPVIGHMKFKHRLDRNFLKGVLGDRINSILSGCGKNLRKLIQQIGFLFFVFWVVILEKIFPKKCSIKNLLPA